MRPTPSAGAMHLPSLESPEGSPIFSKLNIGIATLGMAHIYIEDSPLRGDCSLFVRCRKAFSGTTSWRRTHARIAMRSRPQSLIGDRRRPVPKIDFIRLAS